MLMTLEAVFGRPGLHANLRSSGRSASEITAAVRAAAEIVAPVPVDAPSLRDADDVAMLEWGWAARPISLFRATVICSS